MDILKEICLGAAQGVLEWLPVSSEGVLFLIKTNFFNFQSLELLIKEILFLHLGTFLAALIYFKKDVNLLIKTSLQYRSATKEMKKMLNFLLIGTAVSGLIGLVFISLISRTEKLSFAPKIITIIIGIMLLVTALIQLKASNKEKMRSLKDINLKDGLITGIAQGFAVLPGLSRSGLTVSSLLLRKIDDFWSLKLSFLLSLPIVLGGNIILNFPHFSFSWGLFIEFLSSFIFGILTIHTLLKIAKKLNFGYFVLIFALITLTAGFLI